MEEEVVAGGAAVESFYSTLRDISASELMLCSLSGNDRFEDAESDGVPSLESDDASTDSDGDSFGRIALPVVAADSEADSEADDVSSPLTWFVVSNAAGILSMRAAVDPSQFEIDPGCDCVCFGNDEVEARRYVAARNGTARSEPSNSQQSGVTSSPTIADSGCGPNLFETPGMRQLRPLPGALPAITEPPPLPSGPLSTGGISRSVTQEQAASSAEAHQLAPPPVS